jgi:hypothetical protein
MTKDKIMEVLNRYKTFLKNIGPPIEHCYWMILQIEDWMLYDDTDMEKLMRWLGFIQGVLWAERIFTINELREHNRG